MDSSTLSTLIHLTLFFGIASPIVSSYYFRKVINYFAFNGMDKRDVEQFMANRSFKSKLFMTYVTRCNPTEYRCLGRTLFLVISNYIHILAAFLFVYLFGLNCRQAK